MRPWHLSPVSTLALRLLTRRLLLSVLALAVVATACSSEPEAVADPEAPGIVEEATVTPEEAAAEAELTTPRFEGEILDKRDLSIGDCFNEYTWRDRAGTLQQATTRVSCDKPHESQIFLASVHPAPEDQPFVGEPELEAFTQEVCYENFETWVGMDYETSQLEIGVLFPDLQSWGIEPFDRQVSCFVHAYGGGLLRGSMENIGL